MSEPRHALSRRELLAAAAVAPVAAVLPSGTVTGTPDPWAHVRRQFTIEEGLTYLNVGTYGPSTREVADAECRHRQAMNRNFGRFFYERLMADDFVRLVDRTASFVGADRGDIAFTSGATESMSYIANGLELAAGDEVLTTAHEHQAGIYPWLLAARRRGITVRQIPLPTPIPSADEVLNRFEAAVGPRTRVLSFCHVQYTDGCRLPVRRLCALARDRGLISVVDGAQAVGMLAEPVSDLGCDLYATSLHKWLCGPYGTGLMVVAEGIRDRVLPTVVEAHDGWQSGDRFGRDPGEPALDFVGNWPDTMVKYSTNLHYYGPLFAALEPAMDLHEAIGRAEVEARGRALAGRLRTGLETIDGLHVLSPEPPELGTAITSFTVDGLDPRTLRRTLAGQGIVTRYVNHAPFGFEAVRACTHIFNTEADVDRLVEAVRSLAAGRA